MTDKLYHCMGYDVPITFIYCSGNFKMQLSNLTIIYIEKTQGANITIYFEDDNYFTINPSEYVQDQDDTSLFVGDNKYVRIFEEDDIW